MKKLVVFASFLLFVLIPSTYAQSKKEKIEQLITLSMSEKSIDKVMSMFDKMIDGLLMNPQKKLDNDAAFKAKNKTTLTLQEPEILKDSVDYKRKQKVRVILKEFMSDMFVQMKKESLPLYDSIFTETEIDKQLAFVQSEAGKKQLREGLDLVASADFMKLIKGDSSNEIYDFPIGKKQKIDSFISLVMPKDFKNYFDAKTPMTKIIAKEMASQMFFYEKDSTTRQNMLKSFDSIMNANQNNPVIKARQDIIMKIFWNKSIAKLEVFYDKRFTEKDLDQMIIYYSNPEVKEMNKKKMEMMGILMQKIMATELPKFMGKIMKEFILEKKSEHKEI